MEGITSKFAPYSDFNFASMWAWNIKDEMRISKLNGNLVVRFTDYLSGELFYFFLGKFKANETSKAILDLSLREGCGSQLKLVPEDSVKTLDASTFLIRDDRDNFDYIHSVPELITPDTKQVHKKRKMACGFVKNYPKHVLSTFELHELEIGDQVENLLQVWQRKKNRLLLEIQNELIAIERCLAISTSFTFVSLGVFMDKVLVGFTINEVVHDGFYMAHFGKADPSYKGLVEYLESETARRMAELGCSRMNYQQDLGLTGLRQSKMSWQPVEYLKKYTVRERQI